MASTNSASSWRLKDPSLVKFQSVIGGKWVDAKNGATIKVQSTLHICVLTNFDLLYWCLNVSDPATADELGTVPEMGLEETKEAISAASTAFKSWGKTTAKERHDILVRFHKLMQDNAEDLARIIVGLV
jgi:succinate-semialdehyde dehydrogenase / glutarate-semialdehyde dehydrogenase